jgi:hypothetical protein
VNGCNNCLPLGRGIISSYTSGLCQKMTFVDIGTALGEDPLTPVPSGSGLRHYLKVVGVGPGGSAHHHVTQLHSFVPQEVKSLGGWTNLFIDGAQHSCARKPGEPRVNISN